MRMEIAFSQEEKKWFGKVLEKFTGNTPDFSEKVVKDGPALFISEEFNDNYILQTKLDEGYFTDVLKYLYEYAEPLKKVCDAVMALIDSFGFLEGFMKGIDCIEAKYYSKPEKDIA